MRLPRRMELHSQEEIVERWLSTPGVPFDVREILIEWLKDLKEEINHLSTVNVRPHQDQEPFG